MKKMTLLLPAIVLVAACQPGASAAPTAAPTFGPTAAPTAPGSGSGVAGIVADLTAADVPAKVGSAFMTDPIGGEGVVMCVGKESVQTYQFLDHEAALAAAAKIDPKDPSKVGNGIVDWAGTPRFWMRDNVILLYLGTDISTEAALRALLGAPFAQGEGGRMPLPGPDCQ